MLQTNREELYYFCQILHTWTCGLIKILSCATIDRLPLIILKWEPGGHARFPVFCIFHCFTNLVRGGIKLSSVTLISWIIDIVYAFVLSLLSGWAAAGCCCVGWVSTVSQDSSSCQFGWHPAATFGTDELCWKLDGDSSVKSKYAPIANCKFL